MAPDEGTRAKAEEMVRQDNRRTIDLLSEDLSVQSTFIAGRRVYNRG